MASFDSQQDQQIRDNIRDVQEAATAFDADLAARKGLGGSFLYQDRNEQEREITRTWEANCQRFGDPSRPWPSQALDKFKQTLVARLYLALNAREP